jgi:hypothetical protein
MIGLEVDLRVHLCVSVGKSKDFYLFDNVLCCYMNYKLQVFISVEIANDWSGYPFI